MKRDFSGESIFSLLLRGLGAAILRIRGLFYASLFGQAPASLTINSHLFLHNPKYMTIGKSVHIGRFARLECYRSEQLANGPCLLIGDHCSFGDLFHISCVGHIAIGNHCLAASKVLIIDSNHGLLRDASHRMVPPIKRPLIHKGDISIGDNVWLCEGCIILGGSVIPDGAIVPPYSIVKPGFNNFL